MASFNASLLARAPLSAVLMTIFRGNLCDTVLHDRPVTTLAQNEVIYDMGDGSRTLFFIQSGFVKVETVTEDGHALIYDVRKTGDVVGELCAFAQLHQERAVTLEPTRIAAVPFDDILAAVQGDKDLLHQLLRIFSGALSDAYEQLNSVAFSSATDRLVRVLARLARELGRPSPRGVEISTRLTQEDLAQMAALSREKVSTAMNQLRAQGWVDYSRGGYIVVDLASLDAHSTDRGLEPRRLAAGQ